MGCKQTAGPGLEYCMYIIVKLVSIQQSSKACGVLCKGRKPMVPFGSWSDRGTRGVGRYVISGGGIFNNLYHSISESLLGCAERYFE